MSAYRITFIPHTWPEHPDMPEPKGLLIVSYLGVSDDYDVEQALETHRAYFPDSEVLRIVRTHPPTGELP